MSRWTASLDALAALVGRQRSYVAGEGGLPTDEWAPPADPLPPELLTRVIVLQRETEELAAQVNRRLAANPETPVSPYA